MTVERDVIDELAGIAGDAKLQALRARRPEVRQHLQASDAALFAPDDEGGLLPAERHAAALRVGVQHNAVGIYGRHRAALQALGWEEPALRQVEAPQPLVAPRLAAILAHADLLTSRPREAGPASLQALRAHGLGEREIVSLAQLVAYVNFQVRLVAGLQLLRGRGADPAPPAESARGVHFTLEPLEWASWLQTVRPEQATREQLAILDESHASARNSPYYLTLLHDPQALRERSRLFNAVMYGNGGLARAERELATVAVSRINGCAYCASVHARFYVQLSKDADTAQRLLDEGVETRLTPRQRALVDYAAALTVTPPGARERDLAALKRSGFSDLEVLDATHAVAMFAWANRLMQTLGEPATAPRD